MNPPLLPIPDEIPYPFVGDGGQSGLDITLHILKGGDTHLEKTLNTANRGDDDGVGATHDARINTSATWGIRSRCMYDDTVQLFN